MENIDSSTPHLKEEDCFEKEDLLPDPEPEFILGDTPLLTQWPTSDTDNTHRRYSNDKKLLGDCKIKIERCDKQILYDSDPETQEDDKSLLQELVALVQPESNQDPSNTNSSTIVQDLVGTPIKKEPDAVADDFSGAELDAVADDLYGADDNPVSEDEAVLSTRISNENIRSRSQPEQTYILATQILEKGKRENYFENAVETNDFTNYEANGSKIKTHTDDIFCKCVQCNEIFNSNKAMQNQKSIKKEPKSRAKYMFKCYSCHEVFDRPSRLKAHTDSKCDKLKLFGCDYCLKGYLTKSLLKKHLIYTHQTEKRDEYKCDICDTSFLKKSGLKVHIKVHNKSIAKQVKCKLCCKTLKNYKSMQAHIRRLHTVEEDQYECAYCGKRFGYKTVLIIHIERHMGLRSFHCSICKRYFNTNSELDVHIAANSCSRPKYVCDMCGKICNVKTILDNHKLTHSDEKPLACDKCGKCFRTESNLTQHSVTHSDVRPFKCDECDKAFRIRNHLRQHMAVHGMASLPNYRKKSRNKLL